MSDEVINKDTVPGPLSPLGRATVFAVKRFLVAMVVCREGLR